MTPPEHRRNRWRVAAGVLVLCAAVIGVGIFAWDWNWFRPLIARRISAAIGRTVTLEGLEVQPGRVTTIVGHGVHVADGDQVLADIPTITVTFNLWTWLHGQGLVLQSVVAAQPSVQLVQTDSAHNNWTFPILQAATGASDLEIGDLVIEDGTVHLTMANPAADVALKITTSGTPDARNVVIEGTGTYAKQAITLRGNAGALLRLRDVTTPYPVDFTLTNGPTKITVKGTVRDAFAISGADLVLTAAGPDMELLFPLTGIPIPKTPPYNFSGKLGLADRKFHLSDIKGKVGSSDLNGTLELDPRPGRPLLSGSLISHHVDLQDLGGFIGSEPGRTTTPGQSAAQVALVAQAQANPKLLPDRQISIPKLLSADVHLQYRGEHVLGTNVPFDAVAVLLDITAGHIRLDPMRLNMSGGTVTGYVDLNPVGDLLDADTSVRMDHVNLGGLLKEAGLGSGQGPIDGTARLKGRGASMSQIVGQGEGAMHIVMPVGGQVNSLLIDLSGGEIGRAILAALGVPDHEAVRCMVADMVLHHGVLATRDLAIDTSDHIITGGGRIDLLHELIELQLRTDAKHFTIGKLATPVTISGTFKKVGFKFDSEAYVRGGVAVGLGLLFPPAAILPTIQFGVGDASPCAAHPPARAAPRPVLAPRPVPAPRAVPAPRQ
jgi:uncharacterized protein involved in outer membrane biogenesis